MIGIVTNMGKKKGPTCGSDNASVGLLTFREPVGRLGRLTDVG